MGVRIAANLNFVGSGPGPGPGADRGAGPGPVWNWTALRAKDHWTPGPQDHARHQPLGGSWGPGVQGFRAKRATRARQALMREDRFDRHMPKPIFLAAPDRGHGAQALIEALLREIQVATGGALKGSHVFVPHLAISEGDSAAYFTRSLEAIQQAAVVVAVLDGPQVDENVALWMGYAFAAQRPIVGYVTDARAKGPMVASVVAEATHDVKQLAAALAGYLSQP